MSILRHERMLRLGRLAWTVAVVVTLTACGPSEGNPGATATVAAEATAKAAAQTSTARSVAVSNAATATSVAATAAVERVLPTQTVIAAATEIAATSEKAAVVFTDSFVDNRNFWKLGSAGDFETTDLVDGSFQVTWNGKMSSSEFYEVAEFRNFLAETDCQVVENVAAGSCAVTFAWQSGVGYYRFELFADYYRLFLQMQDQEPLILAEGAPQSAYVPETYNRIKVLRDAARIRVTVNDIQLVDVEDDTLFLGKVGISTASYSDTQPVVIRFDAFTIATLGE